MPTATPNPGPNPSPSPTPETYPTNPVPPGAQVTTLLSNHGFNEGPVWIPSLNSLIFTDQKVQLLYRWDAATGMESVFRSDAKIPNGNILDLNGHLITVEGFPAKRVGRTNLMTMETTTVADRFEGKKFNSPNDLVLYKDGSIYFTDPTYGDGGQRELGFQGVFRVLASGEVKLITKEFDQPNGIVFSPDYKTLFVSDSGRENIRKFALNENGEVVSDSVFYAPGNNMGNAFDGMTMDQAGNLYTSGRKGVTILNPSGSVVAFINVGENTTNVTFGGPDGKTLFITCATTLRKIDLLIPGM